MPHCILIKFPQILLPEGFIFQKKKLHTQGDSSCGAHAIWPNSTLLDCSFVELASESILIGKLIVKIKRSFNYYIRLHGLLMRPVNIHHFCFFTKLSSDQLRIQPQLGVGHLFNEILCNHFEYNCINCMKHVRVI